MGLVGDAVMPTEVDTLLRATSVRKKAGTFNFVAETEVTVQLQKSFSSSWREVPADSVLLVGWVDLTKIGVLGQKDIGKIGAWCEKLVAKNPTGVLP